MRFAIHVLERELITQQIGLRIARQTYAEKNILEYVSLRNIEEQIESLQKALLILKGHY